MVSGWQGTMALPGRLDALCEGRNMRDRSLNESLASAISPPRSSLVSVKSCRKSQFKSNKSTTHIFKKPKLLAVGEPNGSVLNTEVCSRLFFSCRRASALLSDCICLPQGNLELEPPRGQKRPAAVCGLGTPGPATGKKCPLKSKYRVKYLQTVRMQRLLVWL